jgi:hypothetical protein
MHKTRRVESQDLKAGFEHDGRIARSEGFHNEADRAEANAEWLEETLREAFNIVDATRAWRGGSTLSVVVDVTVRIEERENQ